MHILISIENINTRNRVHTSNINSMLRIRLHSRIIEVRRIGNNSPQTTVLIRLERINGIGISLGSKERRDNPVIQHNKRTTILSILIRGNSHTLQEVHGSVRGYGGGRPHRAHEDNWLAAVY